MAARFFTRFSPKAEIETHDRGQQADLRQHQGPLSPRPCSTMRKLTAPGMRDQPVSCTRTRTLTAVCNNMQPRQHGSDTGTTHLFSGSTLLQVAFVVAGRELRAGSCCRRALPDGCSRHRVSLPGHRPRTKGRSVIRGSDTPSPMR